MLNPKQIRIVFLGTPEFASYSLERLVAEKYNIVGVVTVPDKPAGRGQQVQKSAVKTVAEQHGIPVLQPEKLKSPDFLEQLKALKPDLMIVVAFRMLPEVVWSTPPMGTFNLHGSLLPHYRGAAPINRAVMNGEKFTGITTFFLKHEIDTGNIIFREEIPIGKNETAGELHDKMMVAGAELIIRTVNAIAEGDAPSLSQNSLLGPGEKPKEAPKLNRENCRIDWKLSGEAIRNHVRGLSPYPAAWTILKRESGEEIPFKVFRCEFEKTNSGRQIKFSERMEVAVHDGIIRIMELQMPGKKRMKVEEFLNGYRLTEADHLIQ